MGLFGELDFTAMKEAKPDALSWLAVFASSAIPSRPLVQQQMHATTNPVAAETSNNRFERSGPRVNIPLATVALKWNVQSWICLFRPLAKP